MSSINLCIIQIIFFDMFSRLRKNCQAKFHETIIFGADLNNFFKIEKGAIFALVPSKGLIISFDF